MGAAVRSMDEADSTGDDMTQTLHWLQLHPQEHLPCQQQQAVALALCNQQDLERELTLLQSSSCYFPFIIFECHDSFEAVIFVDTIFSACRQRNHTQI